MQTLPASVLLVVSISLSSLELYGDTTFWPAEFLLKSQLLAYGNCFVHDCCSSLAAFNTLSFLKKSFFNTVYVAEALFWLILLGTPLCFLDLLACFLSQVREVFSHCVSNMFSPLSGTPIRWLLCMMLSQRYLKPTSFLFILYPFCSCHSDI